MRPGPERHVANTDVDQLAHPQTRLDGGEQQGVVSSPEERRRIRCGEQCVDLCVGEERDHPAIEALGRDGEHPFDDRSVLGVTQRGEPE